jgi:hypothetical protein
MQYATPAPAQPASGLAISSLVTGVVGLVVPLVNIVAIILGILGIRKARQKLAGGMGLAVAGLTLGCVGLFVSTCAVSSIAILLPPLSRAREMAIRAKCASNMRQIGQGLLLYANDNGGQYPPSLKELIVTLDIGAEVFVCPSSGADVAPGPTSQAKAANLTSPKHLSYVYLGSGMASSAAGNVILVYEPLSNHDKDGINVLYGDGSVVFLAKGQAQTTIANLATGRNPPP